MRITDFQIPRMILISSCVFINLLITKNCRKNIWKEFRLKTEGTSLEISTYRTQVCKWTQEEMAGRFLKTEQSAPSRRDVKMVTMIKDYLTFNFASLQLIKRIYLGKF